MKKRPVSRYFWNYIKFLPRAIRSKIIQAKFTIDYDFPKDIILKQAETADEIKQALTIVHDSYVDLNYIDPVESKIRFLKYHALPTTVILIAKQNDEVIATITIIPDSAFGLPVEKTWSLEKYRNQGRLMAEISSLAIKKSYRSRRGSILLPLCKIMHTYCAEIFKFDGIVIATTLEVEPFYTDVLLFEKVVPVTGQKHSLVKGNPSTCCYLALGSSNSNAYKKEYNHKPKNRNLFHFFFVETTDNILLPPKMNCLQSYTIQKNFAQAQMISEFIGLIQDFSDQDKLIINNLDASGSMPYQLLEKATLHMTKRSHKRFEVFIEAVKYSLEDSLLCKCIILNLSKNGFKIKLPEVNTLLKLGSQFHLFFVLNDRMVTCFSEVTSIHKNRILGCELTEDSTSWNEFLREIELEVSGPINQLRRTKAS